ncbi:MAG: pyridoxal phosphate-dependent aminotransferase family protein [Pseudomonadota bacterium]
MPGPGKPVPSLTGTSARRADGDRADSLAQLLNGGLLGTDPSTGVATGRPGLNFAAQDYLGLADHPAVRAAANSAQGQRLADDRGRAIEARLAATLNLPCAATFASGSDAIRQTLAAILAPDDDVLIDSAAPSAMFDTVLACRAGLYRFSSGSIAAVERRLVRLARQRRRGRLVIAVPAVSAHGSKVADLADLTQLARLHDARLVVDVSHDVGAMGQDGGGVMEVQGCLGRIDIVVGSLVKCFGANGGFAAFRDPDFGADIRRGASPLAPPNASAILAASEIAFGPEGRRRRRNLHGMSLRLRNHLMADGARVMGAASPLVPVLLPAGTALPRTALLESAGPRVALLQAPTVPLHAPRWRIQLNAMHGPADIDDLAELIRDVSRAFDRRPARMVVTA